jgi:hypothetical protein
MNRHQRTVLKIVLGVWVRFAAGGLSAAFQQDCTLKPTDGTKRSAQSGGVNGKMNGAPARASFTILFSSGRASRDFPVRLRRH